LSSDPPFAKVPVRRLSRSGEERLLSRPAWPCLGRRPPGLASREDCSLPCLCAFAAITIAAALRVSPLWWALIILCIAIVVALEALNSALEYVIDRLHPEIHAEIGCAKDAAAGAVLLASIGAALVGALMLLDWWRG
jgi:diacylglycerol kinase (ATP)